MFENCVSLIKFSLQKYKIKETASEPNLIKINEEEENLIEKYIEDFNSNEGFYQGLKNFDSFSEYSEILEENQKSSCELNKSTLKNILENLKNIPENSTDLSGMFYNCSSLLYIRDLYEWNTNNIININAIFNGCSSLLS